MSTPPPGDSRVPNKQGVRMIRDWIWFDGNDNQGQEQSDGRLEKLNSGQHSESIYCFNRTRIFSDLYSKIYFHFSLRATLKISNIDARGDDYP